VGIYKADAGKNDEGIPKHDTIRLADTPTVQNTAIKAPSCNFVDLGTGLRFSNSTTSMEADSARLHGLPTAITVEIDENQKGQGECGELPSGTGCGCCASPGQLDW
jgi:hypothetical protein